MIYIYIIRTCYKRWIEVLPKPVAVTFLLGILPNFQLPLLKVSRASHHIFSTYMYRYKLCMYKWNKYIDLKRKLIHVNTCIYILRGMIEPPKAQNCFADWFGKQDAVRLLEWFQSQASLHENAKTVKHRTLALAEESRSYWLHDVVIEKLCDLITSPPYLTCWSLSFGLSDDHQWFWMILVWRNK